MPLLAFLRELLLGHKALSMCFTADVAQTKQEKPGKRSEHCLTSTTNRCSCSLPSKLLLSTNDCTKEVTTLRNVDVMNRKDVKDTRSVNWCNFFVLSLGRAFMI